MSTASPSETSSDRSRTGLLLAAAVLVVCAVVAVFYGVSWAAAANDESVGFAAERDDAQQAGRTAIVNFTTLDYRDVQHGLDLWLSSSTGPLHEDVARSRNDKANQIAQAKTRTTSNVIDSAVTELDQRAGKARMIAVVDVVATPEGQQPARQQHRLQAELTREGTQWKLSGLAPVSVG